MRLGLVVLVACSSPAAPPAATPAHAPPPPLPVVTRPLPVDPVCGVQPAAAPDADAGETYPDVERLATSKDACAVADNNLAREEAAILGATTHATAAPAVAWDHRAKPKLLDLIARRFELRSDELALVQKQGVAVPARLEMPSYTNAYHEIFQSQLPVYITADSIFHAIFASHDAVVAALENEQLEPLLSQALDDMHCALAAAAASYRPETARDLDFYLLVGRQLLSATPEQIHSAFGDPSVEREARDIVAKISAASELATVTVFSRARRIDFTAYQPRGHYAEQEYMQRYFRAAMWASRLEFNLVSRSSASSAPGPEPDPHETPREALDALALADLATRSNAAPPIATLDRAWAVLAGKREDVSIAQLAELRARVGDLRDAHAFDKLKAAIGDRFQRTTRIHPMPEGSKILPAIATLLGPRIVPDAQAIMPLAHSAVPGRNWVGIADVAYTLGDDAARAYLAKDLADYPKLADQLEVARTLVANAPAGDDLYSAWLGAIRAAAKPAPGTHPAFAATPIGDALRVNTIAAAYGQLKHDYVLVAGQPYAEFGCEIPDGYVEPVPAVYAALSDYAERGAKLVALLDAKKGAGVKAHFDRVAHIMRVLKAIADDELAGRALTADEKHWLGMVAELNINLGVDTTGHPPMYTGWYFDLFFERQDDGMRSADFVADYFTGQKGVAYAGATNPRMGVFVVDSNGPPRAFVGPVARGYEARGPLAQRYTDQAPPPTKLEPWAAPYTIAAAPPPPSVQIHTEYGEDANKVTLTSKTALGPITIKLLDHHRVPFATKRLTIKPGDTALPFAKQKRIGALYVEIGDFRDFVIANAYGELVAQWGEPPPKQE
jgi:hypothetical protein